MKEKKGKTAYFLLSCLIRPLSLLPLSFHRRCGRAMGRFAYSVLRYRRDVVNINLARCFPERKYGEIRKQSRKFYEHFGKILGEAVWFGAGNRNGRIRKSHIVEISNPELVNELYDKGRSVIALAAHNGNWELIGGYPLYCYGEQLRFSVDQICVVYRKLSSPGWDLFMRRNRTAALDDPEHYEGMVESFNILRYALRHRDEKKLYNFITDQHPYSKSSCVDVDDFMGQPTKSMDGAVSLAHKLGMSVVYLGMKCREDGGYTMHFSLIAEDASTVTAREMLDSYYSLLEKDIREQPWNYLWTHKRWK